ncbi:MAG: EpsG family protein [Prolixibacteraceae bacterium]
MFYLGIFLIILFFAAHDYDRQMNRFTGNMAYLLLFLIFWLLAGLRYETGVDWPGYIKFFNKTESIEKVIGNASGSFMKTEFEFGYVLLNSILKTFTDNVQWLFLLTALISSLMLFSSLRKYSEHVFVSLMIYFGTVYFILDMSGIRQCIALNLFLLSLDFIIKRQFLKYLLAIGIASMFHITSLLLLPLYFILHVEFNNRILIAVVGCGIIISFFHIAWLRFFMEKMIDSFYINSITGKLYGYSNRADVRNFGVGSLLNAVIFIFCILKRNQLKQNSLFNVLLNMYVISLFFYYFTWELNEFSSRFRLYFSIGNIILFTYFIDIYQQRINKLIVFLFIVSFSVFYGRPYLFETQEGIAYNPYQNYITHKIFKMESTGQERLLKFKNARKN